MNPPRFHAAGDGAVLASWGDAIDDPTFQAVLALDRAFADAPPPGMIETVPAYTSLLVVFDPLVTDHAAIEVALRKAQAAAKPQDISARPHHVAVDFAPDAARDLAAVARQRGLSAEQAIAAFVAGEYKVFMYGFAPGYAYLGGVPPALHIPRKPAPVRDVPVGSVLIAGEQCLISTLPMPTGWWVIGRTDARVLDPGATKPFLFDPGDTVHFAAAI